MNFKSVHYTEGYVTESKKVNMVCVYSWSPISLQDLLKVLGTSCNKFAGHVISHSVLTDEMGIIKFLPQNYVVGMNWTLGVCLGLAWRT